MFQEEQKRLSHKKHKKKKKQKKQKKLNPFASQSETGQQIGEYQLIELIGEGSFGKVYKAMSVETGEFVAVKSIPLSRIPQTELNSTVMEIDLLKKLDNEYIVKYIGSHQTKTNLYIILEWIENGSLREVLKGIKTVKESLVAKYTFQTLNGLNYLHEQGVVHRDIKGANLLTTKQGRIKLTDFGVSTRLDEVENNSSALGTPYWMAPEVIEMLPPSTSCDIWSVGCTVIELLTGKPPYTELSPVQALYKIVQEDGPTLPGGISMNLRSFLLECFQKDPNLRISAQGLLKHPWMRNAEKAWQKEIQKKQQPQNENGEIQNNKTKETLTKNQKDNLDNHLNNNTDSDLIENKNLNDLEEIGSIKIEKCKSVENKETLPFKKENQEDFKKENLYFTQNEKLYKDFQDEFSDDFNDLLDNGTYDFATSLSKKRSLRYLTQGKDLTSEIMLPFQNYNLKKFEEKESDESDWDDLFNMNKNLKNNNNQKKKKTKKKRKKKKKKEKEKEKEKQTTKQDNKSNSNKDYKKTIGEVKEKEKEKDNGQDESDESDDNIGSDENLDFDENIDSDGNGYSDDGDNGDEDDDDDDDDDDSELSKNEFDFEFQDSFDFAEKLQQKLEQQKNKNKTSRHKLRNLTNIKDDDQDNSNDSNYDDYYDDEIDENFEFSFFGESDEENLGEVSLVKMEERKISQKLTSTIIELIESLKPEENEQNILNICENLCSIFKRNPETKNELIKYHGVIPIMEMLEVENAKVLHAVLKVVNQIIESNKIVQENLCLVGGVPLIMKFASSKYSNEIREEASKFIYQICHTSPITLQMFIACRGLPVLVDLLKVDYETQRIIILRTLKNINSVFQLQSQTPKNDFCRLFAKAGLLKPLVEVLGKVREASEKAEEGMDTILLNISKLLFTFSQADRLVKIYLTKKKIISKILQIIPKLKGNVLVWALKTIKNISYNPETLENLHKADTIQILTNVLINSKKTLNKDSKLLTDIQNQILTAIFNLCRINHERQQQTAKSGIIPHLQQIIRDNSPLKQLALPIICDFGKTSTETRNELAKYDGINFYIELLSLKYWRVPALDALATWLLDSKDEVAPILFETKNIHTLAKLFSVTNPNLLNHLLVPYLKIVNFSETINKKLTANGLVLQIKKALNHKNADVRISLLKILNSLTKQSEPKMITQDFSLKDLQDILERDKAIIVTDMVNRIIIQVYQKNNSEKKDEKTSLENKNNGKKKDDKTVIVEKKDIDVKNVVVEKKDIVEKKSFDGKKSIDGKNKNNKDEIGIKNVNEDIQFKNNLNFKKNDQKSKNQKNFKIEKNIKNFDKKNKIK
ncbi:mtk1/mekk4 [Anaeramoeba flamelloides]|uniref:Mtk1/mekk4 n=1 Tax=Anaeramoeba flamelloides TaxID=1746091 RepID=A0ABQ8ZE38_9EUKA|nr:mtk1/mekk4 [Anaeramoeba flamelloides]